MAETKISSNLSIEFTVTLKMSLAEAWALNQMTVYGVDSFLKGYYKQLGRSYLEPHEAGIRTLFKTIQENLPTQLHNADEYMKAIKGAENIYKLK